MTTLAAAATRAHNPLIHQICPGRGYALSEPWPPWIFPVLATSEQANGGKQKKKMMSHDGWPRANEGTGIHFYSSLFIVVVVKHARYAWSGQQQNIHHRRTQDSLQVWPFFCECEYVHFRLRFARSSPVIFLVIGTNRSIRGWPYKRQVQRKNNVKYQFLRQDIVAVWWIVPLEKSNKRTKTIECCEFFNKKAEPFAFVDL